MPVTCQITGIKVVLIDIDYKCSSLFFHENRRILLISIQYYLSLVLGELQVFFLFVSAISLCMNQQDAYCIEGKACIKFFKRECYVPDTLS